MNNQPTTTTTNHETKRPQYNVTTEGRIANAIARASTARHYAHYLGTSPHDGARVYQVWSNTHDGAQYIVRALEPATARHEPDGYVYGRTAPYYRLTCSCPSWCEYAQPCWHAARVAARLARESRTIARTGHGSRLEQYHEYEPATASTTTNLEQLYK